MDKKVVFIFGAGCSVDDGAPLINDFFDIAFNKVKNLQPQQQERFDAVEEFRRFKLPQSNVEELLSFIDLESVLGISTDSIQLSKIKSDLIYLIGKTIEHKMGTKRSHSYSEFDKNYITDGVSHFIPSIISLNWDIALDNIIIPKQYDMHEKLDKNDIIKWIYNVDYGVPFKSLDDFGNSHNTISDFTPALLKLHGSMNWLFCKKCKEENRKFRYFIYGQKIMVNLFEGQKIECPYCKEPLFPVIVPPSFRKIEENGVLATLKEIWNRAFSVLAEADHIFIVGYSFPSDDVHFRLFLRSALFQNFDMNKKPINIDIINYKKYLTDKTEFENHYKKMIDIPEAEIRPRFHYLKFSEFAKQGYGDYFNKN